MKKCRTMRLASAMLVLTLLSTCMISGTFAKYVTSDSASDSARVAKWGVEVVASGSLFGQHYADEANGNSIIVGDTGTVASSTADDVVAPGTENATGMTFKITGTPEVDTEVVVEEAILAEFANIYLKEGDYAVMVPAVGVTADNFAEYYVLEGSYRRVDPDNDTYADTTPYYEVHDVVNVADDYYPIDWTLKVNGTDTAVVNVEGNETVEAVFAAIKADMDAYDTESGLDKTYVLTWIWDFDANGAGTNDGADTILGNIMAGATVVEKTDSGTNYAEINPGKYSTSVGFNAKITVTQVD